MTKPHVTIYSDGGAKPNPNGPGGWAALLISDSGIREISGRAESTTNNRMELTAAIEALDALNEASEVEFHTDSQYVKNGISEWLAGWVRKGGKTAAPRHAATRNPMELGEGTRDQRLQQPG